ncbi:MAG: Hpt domain-containing protein [Planctomycetota bacterium]
MISGLVALFLEKLEGRIDALRAAWTGRDLEALSSIAHQLRGSAGGCGYPVLTDAAAAVETAIDDGPGDLARLAEKVATLVELCERATAGAPCDDDAPGQ